MRQRAGGKLQPAVGRRRRGLRLRHHASPAVNFQLAQNVALRRGRLGHEHADVAAALRPELEVVGEAGCGWQRLDSLPRGGVLRNLDRSFGRPADPVQRDAVEGAGRAQIHVHPLRGRPRAHPRAGEMVWAACLDHRALVAQDHFADRPAGGAGGGKLHANAAAACGRSKADGEARPHGGRARVSHANPGGRPFRAGGAAQFRPRLPVVGAADHHLPSGGPACVRHGAQSGQLHAVDFERSLAAQQIDLDPRARAVQRHGGDVVAIQRMLAVLFLEHAVAGGNRNPPGQARVADAVRDQLGGQVVIIGAGLVCRPVQRQVAIRPVTGNQDRGEILGRIARINPDAPGIWLCMEHTDNRQK